VAAATTRDPPKSQAESCGRLILTARRLSGSGEQRQRAEADGRRMWHRGRRTRRRSSRVATCDWLNNTVRCGEANTVKEHEEDAVGPRTGRRRSSEAFPTKRSRAFVTITESCPAQWDADDDHRERTLGGSRLASQALYCAPAGRWTRKMETQGEHAE